MLGLRVNLHTMTFEVLPSKRQEIVTELVSWHTKQSYTLREAVQLLGSLEHMCRYTKWGWVWFHGLRNSVRRVIQERGPIALRRYKQLGRQSVSAALLTHLAYHLDQLVQGVLAYHLDQLVQGV